WGDTVETVNGDQSSATHVFGDSKYYGDPATSTMGANSDSLDLIGAAVTGENGTYIYGGTGGAYDTTIHHVTPAATAIGSSNVNVHAVPTAEFATGGTIDEGSPGNVSFSNQSDNNAADLAGGFRYAYDFNNDGIWDVGDGSYGGSVANVSQAVPSSFAADGDA